MPILENHLGGNFNLDSSGIAGFFGGEEAFAAMSSVHLVRARRWLGWYNSPGSYFVAKKYGVLPNSLFWDSVFPGPSVDPTELLELDYKPGFRFSGAYNGTQFTSTGHLSYLLSRFCTALPGAPALWDSMVVGDKKTASTRPHDAINQYTRVRNITVTVVKFDERQFTKWERYPKVPERFFTPINRLGTLFVVLTILFSLAASVLSALYDDWFSFAMILFGSLSNGITSWVLGTGDLVLELSEPSPGATPGDGILFDRQNIIILQGSEHVIDSLLQGRFRLRYPSDPSHRWIGLCSLSLLAQFLLQLFLIPQGTLTGQVFFIASLAMSWMCNSYLASFNREKMQTDLLFKLVGAPRIHKFDVAKWSVAAAFAMFYFNPGLKAPEGILDELMPNNTPAWNVWKHCICAAIMHGRKPSDFIFPDEQTAEHLDTLEKDELKNLNDQGEKYTHAKIMKAFEDLALENDRNFLREFLRKADAAFESVSTFDEKVEFVHAGAQGGDPLLLRQDVQGRSGSLLLMQKSPILPQ
ncbi:hypothetical protein JR316_0001320 [Psilocybe cubensis]|uniref:Uncharacterized protein n=2 Tax=Psilocybe cubensis TaxID=181762 RepID=A0ACB8HIU3_PSICU|nr:hypothetical protein JR316_0001320 [Psilocybe cubensis]KAH9487250.1 hypothetical protein JR316_0001320 [Psilocybe cubensis]